MGITFIKQKKQKPVIKETQTDMFAEEAQASEDMKYKYLRFGTFINSGTAKEVNNEINQAYDYFEGITNTEQIEQDIVKRFVEDLHIPTEPAPTNPKMGAKGKWRVISALQKCIRRGDTTNAFRAAIAAFNGGEDGYMWHRLRVIVLEDIGIANLPLAGLVLSVSGKTKWRAKNGGLYFTLAVVEAMCLTVKDRTLCDIAYTSYCNPDHKELFNNYMEGYNADEAVITYFSNDEIHERQLSGLALSGLLTTGSLKDKNLKTCKRNKDVLRIEMLNSEYPELLKFVFLKGASGSGEGLHLALPTVFDYIMDETITVEEVEIPELVLLKGLPSVAYDMHTFEGKRAYAYLSKYCDEVAEWLATKTYGGDTVGVIGSAVFGIESGAILKTKLNYKLQAWALEQMYVVDAKRYEVSLEDFKELMGIISDNMEDLNYARKRIVVGK